MHGSGASFKHFSVHDISLGGLVVIPQSRTLDEDAVKDVRRALELRFHELLEEENPLSPGNAACRAVMDVLGEIRGRPLCTDQEWADRTALFQIAAEAAVAPMARGRASITLALVPEVGFDIEYLKIYTEGEFHSEEEVLESYATALVELDQVLALFVIG